jgi:Ca-activated chloride channel homolog
VKSGLALFFAIGIAAGVAAQEKKPPAPEVTFSETVGTEYVLLPVVVTDPDGRFLSRLKDRDFRLQVDGKPVSIESFEQDEQAPVSFVFLVDTSGSMQIAGKLERSKEAIRFLIRYRKPGDEFALLSFSEGAVREVAGFSENPVRLLNALPGLEASGRTALYDAVAETTGKILAGKNPKKAIIVFTDGVDNDSRMSPPELETLMQEVNIPVYPLGMTSSAFDTLTAEEKRELSVSTLQLLARSSGGRIFLVPAGEDLTPLVQMVDSELRKEYLLGFAPSGSGDIRYRAVRVSVRRAFARVRTRGGYRGTAPRVAGAQTR